MGVVYLNYHVQCPGTDFGAEQVRLGAFPSNVFNYSTLLETKTKTKTKTKTEICCFYP